MNCDCNKRNKIGTLVGLIAGLILVCVIVSAVTSSLLTQKAGWSKYDQDDGHQWLHKELNLTPDKAGGGRTPTQICKSFIQNNLIF